MVINLFQSADDVDLQYHGSPRTTQSCLDALLRQITIPDHIRLAVLLTCDQDHAFYLETQDPTPVLIKSGFTSGYLGEGPAGLAIALHLLLRHRIEVEEVIINPAMMARLNSSKLTTGDMSKVHSERRVLPTRIYNYMDDGLQGRGRPTDQMRRQNPLVVPWAVLDDRLVDFALEFDLEPDMTVLKAFRRLEALVKERCTMSADSHGLKVFQQAFRGAGAALEWKGLAFAEVEGRAKLFEGAYSAFRNARAHRDEAIDKVRAYREFLLVNELFLLESEATKKIQD